MENEFLGQWIRVDIGFEKKSLDKCRIDMRNQNLKSIYEGRLEYFEDILEPDHVMGNVDPLHCINLFHLCAKNPTFNRFQKLSRMNISYLKDAELNAPADYLLGFNNMEGMSILFEMVKGLDFEGKHLQMDLDKSLMFHGLKQYTTWVQENAEDDMMKKPKPWDDLKLPVFGAFKQSYIMQFIAPIVEDTFLSHS